jgi:osmotically-inducible protein OsmY
MKTYSLVLMSVAVALSACAPAIIGGGAVVGTAAVSEKGISGALSDTQISTQIRAKFYSKDPELYYKVGVTVTNGEVMLAGAVPNDTMQLDAVRLAWEVRGVQRVIDNITVCRDTNLGGFAQDSWITTSLRSSLLFDPDILSVNYSIKTMNGIVYLMGVAQDQNELNRVINHARNTPYVKKVVSYIHIKGEVLNSVAPPLDTHVKKPTPPPPTVKLPASVKESKTITDPGPMKEEEDEEEESED